ncbi:tRNA pseudouridine synthase 10 [Marchantia polymorpha subsp. ruderalis]|uniref:tRNA pseudouridine(55) synthase n=2 Tax=Marchantia polymorpha TaxID=3197 RepID=A0AAF6AXN8_MARPO|nr:hypothetical protein MARPO_0006s0010 [Marchantia polymorpha]BBN04522.1 hypothetical protein Mp_3g05370 [Marchantia polymorpha subsp. ruderalis]|eukprot:PTQ47958.1 hypothetical protein MARPO_0006s0010 [Marchantia polymorpha]
MGFPDALQELLDRLPARVVLELLRQGLCLRCIFRFLNVRDAVYSIELPTPAEVYSKIFSSTEHNQEHELENLKNSVLDENSAPCLICLGVLQRLDHAAGTERQEHEPFEGLEKNPVSCILKAIDDAGHSVDKFCLEVSLPALILLRERSFWCYLKEQYKVETLFSGQDVNDHIVSLKEAVKWSLLERLEHALSAKFDTSAALRIALVFKHPGSPAEIEFLAAASTGGDAKRKRNGGHNEPESQGFAAVVAARAVAEAGESLAAVQRSLASMNNELFVRRYQCPPSQCSLSCEIAAVIWRNPVFVGGRYLKFSRNVSQSRWLIEEERMGEGSVQEIIGDVVMPFYKADNYKFHAAGREDIDVRMLGTGRPFIIELLNARRIPSASEIEKAELDINGQKEGWVKVKGLRQVGIEVCALMRQGEVEKQKEYVAVVWLDRPVTQADFKRLSDLKELEIQQKTPVRVLHRRSPLIRPRTIHWMRCEPIKGSENYFLLQLCTQAGTYIKEFVHGDLGRTYPNVGSLLDCAADILQLDVMDVKMEFD